MADGAGAGDLAGAEDVAGDVCQNPAGDADVVSAISARADPGEQSRGRGAIGGSDMRSIISVFRECGRLRGPGMAPLSRPRQTRMSAPPKKTRANKFAHATQRGGI